MSTVSSSLPGGRRAESRGYRLLYVQIKVSPDNHRDPLDPINLDFKFQVRILDSIHDLGITWLVQDLQPI